MSTNSPSPYYDPNYPQSYPPNYAQNTAQPYPQNYPPNYQQNYPPNYQQNYPQNYQQNYPQNYQQNTAPAPAHNSAPPPAASDDPTQVQYRMMTIDQWSSIPSAQSDYSNYWAQPDSFQPQTFSENREKTVQWNDYGWAIAFLINFVVTIIICIYLSTTDHKTTFNDSSSNSNSKNSSKNSRNNGYLLETNEKDILAQLGYYEPEYLESQLLSTNNTNSTEVTFTTKDFWSCLGFSFGLAFALNVLHICYALFCPGIYVRAALILTLIVAIIIVALLTFFVNVYAFWVFPAIYLIIVIIICCCIYKYIPLTTAILQVGVKIVLTYPGSILLTIISSLVSGVISIAFCYMFYATIASNISLWIFIYYIFSFLWISLCFYYVVYISIAGVASTWYFLNGTEYMPKNPILLSFKRSVTTSFGSCCEASIILAIIKTLETLVSIDLSHGNNGIVALIYLCIKCIVLCILRLLYRIFGILNRYALIYCATFGVPYAEGCRRFLELKTGLFLDVIISSNILDIVLTVMMIFFAVLGAVLGYFAGYLISNNGIIYRVIACICSCLLSIALFEIFQGPLIVSCDTLLICFAESPQHLQTTATDLYEALRDSYGEKLEQKLAASAKA